MCGDLGSRAGAGCSEDGTQATGAETLLHVAHRGSVLLPDIATESRLRVAYAGHALGAVSFHRVAWPYARMMVRLKKSSRSGFEAARNGDVANEQLSARWRPVMNREKAYGDHCPFILA